MSHMTRAACVSALLPAAGMLATLALRRGSRSLLRLARARRMMWRVAGVAAAAVALSLSLVGVSGSATDLSPTMQVGVAATLAIAALLIHGAGGSGTGQR